ncbi:MAG: hypothetical protein ABW321_34960 [Polyangiales bacterium]
MSKPSQLGRPLLAAAEDGGAEDDAGSAGPGELPCGVPVLPPECAGQDGQEGPALPSDLRCTGLYADFAQRQLACGLIEYTPAYELWSDGALKRRWASIPAGAPVDTSNPISFVYPIGTQFWKEFQVRVNGQLQPAETRLLRKLDGGWTFTTYVWSESGDSAIATNTGVADWAGSGHTVPTRDQCIECHAGRPDRVLGWDALLLAEGARGVPPELWPRDDADAGAAPSIPGDEVERAALGYLHVNCGVSCHNDTLEARARDTGLLMQLPAAGLASVQDTPIAAAINKRPTGNAPVQELPEPPEGSFFDLLPLSPARSLVLARMSVRSHPAQMPPLASNQPDPDGIARVTAWITQMTPERGYMPPSNEP